MPVSTVTRKNKVSGVEMSCDITKPCQPSSPPVASVMRWCGTQPESWRRACCQRIYGKKGLGRNKNKIFKWHENVIKSAFTGLRSAACDFIFLWPSDPVCGFVCRMFTFFTNRFQFTTRLHAFLVSSDQFFILVCKFLSIKSRQMKQSPALTAKSRGRAAWLSGINMRKLSRAHVRDHNGTRVWGGKTNYGMGPHLLMASYSFSFLHWDFFLTTTSSQIFL